MSHPLTLPKDGLSDAVEWPVGNDMDTCVYMYIYAYCGEMLS